MTINERIFKIVRQIPKGKVTTYGAIAQVIGIRSSARYVGWALHSSKHSGNIPAHRVVNRNGDLTGKMHFPAPNYMKDMLEAEGVTFKGERVNMSRHLWLPENIE